MGAEEHRFCERQFAHPEDLYTHQKAKHFTCTLCPKKFFNSVQGADTQESCVVLTIGLQNHYKAVHYPVTLSAIPNALSSKSDPTHAAQHTAPPPSLPNPLNRGKLPETKKLKIDTPLDTQTIQAQLAKLSDQKRREETQKLLTDGIYPPPGVSTAKLLDYYNYLSPPPGTGLYAARPRPPCSGHTMDFMYGKSSSSSSSSAEELHTSHQSSTTVLLSPLVVKFLASHV